MDWHLSSPDVNISHIDIIKETTPYNNDNQSYIKKNSSKCGAST